MTEIEARGKIKYRIANEMRKYVENKEEYEDLEIALLSMKELREYRELGTVEDIQLIFSLCKDLERIVKKYEAIGTVEELKALKNIGEWAYSKGYNKAIDEFAEKLKYELNGNIIPDNEKFTYTRKQQEQICHQNTTLKRAIKYVDYIAEQLKKEGAV